MTDIFISYKSDDRDRIKPIMDMLHARGFDVFWDQSVPTGMNWDEWIKDRLGQAKVAVVFWSLLSVKSPNVHHEAEIAKLSGKLIPVLLDSLGPELFPMGHYSQQAIQLTNWSGDQTDERIIKIVDSIEARCTPIWLSRRISEMRFATSELSRQTDEFKHDLLMAEQRRAAERADERATKIRLESEKERLTSDLERITLQLNEANEARRRIDSEQSALSHSLKDFAEKANKLEIIQARHNTKAAAIGLLFLIVGTAVGFLDPLGTTRSAYESSFAQQIQAAVKIETERAIRAEAESEQRAQDSVRARGELTMAKGDVALLREQVAALQAELNGAKAMSPGKLLDRLDAANHAAKEAIARLEERSKELDEVRRQYSAVRTENGTLDSKVTKLQKELQIMTSSRDRAQAFADESEQRHIRERNIITDKLSEERRQLEARLVALQNDKLQSDKRAKDNEELSRRAHAEQQKAVNAERSMRDQVASLKSQAHQAEKDRDAALAKREEFISTLKDAKLADVAKKLKEEQDARTALETRLDQTARELQDLKASKTPDLSDPFYRHPPEDSTRKAGKRDI